MFECIHDCIWSIIMAGKRLNPVFICNDCINLDWTIDYLSTTTNISLYKYSDLALLHHTDLFLIMKRIFPVNTLMLTAAKTSLTILKKSFRF